MSALLNLYKCLTCAGKPVLTGLLRRRMAGQKEDPVRIGERMGQAGRPRPQGKLVWIHGASVGESVSTLILIDAIERHFPGAHILVTTGTVTSAALMEKRLPPQAAHQYIPVDHPAWTASFLDHWEPDLALWMESELWPNMVMETGKRNIPLVLVNARLSDKSFTRWRWAKSMARAMMAQFTLVLAQTGKDAERFRLLGARKVESTGNLKYSSAPLPYDHQKLSILSAAIKDRPLWVYASSHDGEETLACRVHEKLKAHIPGLLTIIVPRHIQRRGDIAATCRNAGLSYRLRGDNHAIPGDYDDIYIADTMGELGLFYRLSPIALIGRSFSNDGGGGHNPVEAAQLGCAVLTGPNVQYQQQMFDDMFRAGAAAQIKTEEELYTLLANLLTHPDRLKNLQERAAQFAQEKSHIIDSVMNHLSPLLAVLEGKDAA